MYQNVLDEPSPLGLRLKKSPSLLDLIQMRLSQASNVGESSMDNSGSELSKKKDNKSGMSTAGERLKASNFPANILKIGTWEVRFFNFFCCSLWVLPEPQYASGPCIPFFCLFYLFQQEKYYAHTKDTMRVNNDALLRHSQHVKYSLFSWVVVWNLSETSMHLCVIHASCSSEPNSQHS